MKPGGMLFTAVLTKEGAKEGVPAIIPGLNGQFFGCNFTTTCWIREIWVALDRGRQGAFSAPLGSNIAYVLRTLSETFSDVGGVSKNVKGKLWYIVGSAPVGDPDPAPVRDTRAPGSCCATAVMFVAGLEPATYAFLVPQSLPTRPRRHVHPQLYPIALYSIRPIHSAHTHSSPPPQHSDYALFLAPHLLGSFHSTT